MKAIPGRLDPSALAKLSQPVRPAAVCRNCWITWSAAPLRPPFGYCHHRGTAWRIRASGRVRTFACTHAEYRDLLASLEAKP